MLSGVQSIFGGYLETLRFNVDFSPVADVLTNSANQVIGDRSLGSDLTLVSEMARFYEKGLNEHGIFAVYKHFSGHGSTIEDSHEGYAHIDKTKDQLLEEDIVPFRDAIDNGADFIMVGHISMPDATEGKNIPASLLEYFVTELRRESLVFDGVVITDALGMGAISQNYTSGKASVMAIEVGCDMLLMASGFKESYEAVLYSVKSGGIEEDSLDGIGVKNSSYQIEASGWFQVS